MSFELPEEVRMLKETVRKFVRRELVPLENDHPDGRLPQEQLKRIQAKARDLGLWLLDVPEEYGGAGLNALSLCAVWEELYQTAAVPNRGVEVFGPMVGPILLHCNESQRERYLFPLLRGEKRTCFAQTEPEAGSDPGAMKTRAVRHGDVWVINGVKRFITGAQEADFMQLMAVTDPEKRQHGGVTCFLVDMDTPGVRISRIQETVLGETLAEIVLEDVQVAGEQMVGKEGEGFRLGQRWLTLGRLRQAANAVGVAQRALAMTVVYAKQRVTFGKPLAERQAIQFMLVDSQMELDAARLMMYHCAALFDRGEDVRYEAAMAKIFAVEMASRVLDRAIQIHGGTGLTKDLPLGRWFMDMRSKRITEGPTEVLRNFVARDVLARYY